MTFCSATNYYMPMVNCNLLGSRYPEIDQTTGLVSG